MLNEPMTEFKENKLSVIFLLLTKVCPPKIKQAQSFYNFFQSVKGFLWIDFQCLVSLNLGIKLLKQ